MFLYLLLVSILLICAYLSIRGNALPPGPLGLPILGYLPWLNPKAPYESLTKLSKKYGPIYGLYLGSVYTVVISDHKLVRKVFAKDATTGRAPLYLTHGIMKGYGLICAENELWKDQRKFVSGSLKQLGISKFGPKREKIESLIMIEVNDFIDCIKENVGNEKYTQLDPLNALRHNLGSVVNRIVFGKSWSRQDPLWKWLQNLQEEGTKHIGVAGPLNFLPFLRFLPKYKNTMNFLLDGKHKTHKFYQEFIQEQQKILHDSKDDNNLQFDNIIQAFLIERKRRKESADIEKFYNDEQFYHLLADIFGAGLDTTLTTLRWYLLYMAKNSVVQKKVQEEIDIVLQGRSPCLNDLQNMPYTEASLCEAQRIRSVVPVGIPHGTTEETDINGYKIPKGTMIIPLQWAIHMDTNIWKNPQEFNPLRFLSEEGKFIKPEAFMPFQTGKRMCIGDEFAKMLLFLFGATIFQKFRISPLDNSPPDLNGECGITLTPKQYNLTFALRRKEN